METTIRATRREANGAATLAKALFAALAALAFALIMSAFAPASAWADDSIAMNGSCGAEGSNLTWGLTENNDVLYATYDDAANNFKWSYSTESSEGSIQVSGYTLKITGSGAMVDYTRSGETAAPWNLAIKSLVLSDDRYTSLDDSLAAKRGNDEIANPRITKIEIDEGITYIGAHAFRSTGISEIEIPNSVSKIGDYALIRCAGLESISIAAGENAERPFYVEDGALYENYQTEDGVSGVELRFWPAAKTTGECKVPEGVTAIGSNSMQDGKFTSIALPSTIRSINSYAFSSSSLSSIRIPDGVGFGTERELGATPGAGVFAGNRSLASVENASFGDSIPAGFLQSCPALKSFEIPEGVKTIGASAFKETPLLKISIPASVETIESWAFQGVAPVDGSQLEIAFAKGSNLSKVGTGILYGVDDYKAVFSQEDMSAYLVFTAAGLKAELDGKPVPTDEHFVYAWADSDALAIVAINGERQKSYVIPDEVDGYKVVSIADNVFAGTSNSSADGKIINSVKIGANIKSIGTSAFKYCTGLNDIDLSEAKSLETIADFAFYDVCKDSAGSGVVFDLSDCAALKSIGTNAFRYSGYSGIKLPDGITSWGNNAIGSASVKVTTAVSTDTLNTLLSALSSKRDAFSLDESNLSAEYGNLKYIVSADQTGKAEITVVGFAEGAADKTEINIPDEIEGTPVTSVKSSAFQGALGETKKITIGANVSSIGDYAFDCVQGKTSPLSEITFNDGCAVSVGTRAFQKFGGTSSIAFDAGNREISFGDNVFLSSPITKMNVAGATALGKGILYGNGSKLGVLVVNGSASCSANTFVNTTGGASSAVSISKAMIYEVGEGAFSADVESQLIGARNTVCKTNGGTFPADTSFEGGALATPVKEGYSFNGWYDNADFSGNPVTTAESGKVYYASWTKAVAKPAPVADRNLVYNGADQTYKFDVAADDDGYCSISGNVAKDAGKYTATASLKNGAAWDDGTTADLTFEYSIAKAKAAVSFAGVDNGVVTATQGDADFTQAATATGVNGEIISLAYDSSNPAVAEVDQAGKVHVKSSGTTTITAGFDEQDEPNYEPTSATYELTVRAASVTDPAGDGTGTGVQDNPLKTTYGDKATLAVKISAKPASDASVLSADAPETEVVPVDKNEVGFYYNGTLLGDHPVSYDAQNGTATFEYDTTKQTIPAGSVQVVDVKFGGSDTLAPSEGKLYIEIAKAVQSLRFDKSEVSQHVGTFNNAISGAFGTISYESSNTNVATVADDGAATIVSPGKSVITATVSGDEWHTGATASYAVVATDHDFAGQPYVYGVANPAKGHWQVCKFDGCSAESAVAAHQFGDWTVTKKATSTAAGEEARTCADCGYVETKAIAATGNAGKDNGKNDGDAKPGKGDGGDSGANNSGAAANDGNAANGAAAGAGNAAANAADDAQPVLAATGDSALPVVGAIVALDTMLLAGAVFAMRRRSNC